MHRDPAVVESKVLRAAKRGDVGAQQRVVQHHFDLVRAVASRYAGLGLGCDDLVQEGCVGLLDAVARWDDSRGVPFEAFARFRIRVAIRDALTARARLIRLPKHVSERRRALTRIDAALTAEARRPPSTRELADAAGVALSRVERAWLAPVADPGLVDGRDAAGDPGPEDDLLALEEARLVDAAVEGLPSRQRLVIRHHFGLDGQEESIGEIAEELQLSRRRTLSIERQALASLRRALAGLRS